jgi:hypothetical protein
LNLGAPINALEADGAIHIDSARFVWFLSQDDEEKESFGDIITIIKDNGGVSADEVKFVTLDLP